MTVRQIFFISSIVISLLSLILALQWPTILNIFWLLVPLILLGTYDMMQKNHTIMRLYPVIGRFRYIFESIRPEIQQYFVESDTNGAPVSREFRTLVYQRAKGQRDTRPFGTVFEVYRDGYEWINHSLVPKSVKEEDLRVNFGGSDCTQPYAASPVNISAMSYGALSKSAIRALIKGAKLGNFAHNTGEGGISPYHQEAGGDLIWQIGTGYFGCRNAKGNFDTVLFQKTACKDTVKMIEIKLSQGAKPGHGGILPAIKLTQEIADIRHVPMGEDVISPAAHTAFSTPIGLLEFVAQLRQLSAGKPIGFKLCLGNRAEFLAICKAMVATGITPDFITVDGGEGGTGAAPIELTNSVGTPLRDALIFIHSALRGVGLRDQIRIIASGKAISAFHVLRLIALGADTVNMARAMMFSLGCIQSRHCNSDTCPTGIATQNPARYKALDVENKAKRVARYHYSIVENLKELLAACGLESLDELKPWHINRRVDGTQIKHYEELYPCISEYCLLSPENIPKAWKADWKCASATHW
jgi:glutamate synthase domain-containing protein 2